jgi:hypothetical protein
LVDQRSDFVFWLKIAATFNFEDFEKSVNIPFVQLPASKHGICFKFQVLEFNDDATLVELSRRAAS